MMEGRTLKEMRDELRRLMLEQVESLKAQTYGGLNEQGLREEDERLKRIREVSADYLAALKDGSGWLSGNGGTATLVSWS
jgi:hypothetical protein